MGDERKDKQKQQERLNEQKRQYRNDRQREHGTGDGGAELRERHDQDKNHKDKA